MLPNGTRYYLSNGAVVDPEHPGKPAKAYFLLCAEAAHFSYLVLSHFADGSISTFCYHVVHVLEVGAKPKVGRIDARRVVTGMTHKHCGRDWAYQKLIGETVRLNVFVGDSEASVFAPRKIAHPKPTGVGLFDIFPKAFNGRLSMFVVASQIAISSACRLAAAALAKVGAVKRELNRGIGYTSHVGSLLERLLITPKDVSASLRLCCA